MLIWTTLSHKAQDSLTQVQVPIHQKGKTMFLKTTLLLLVVACPVAQTGFAQKLKLDKYRGTTQSIFQVRIASASIVPDKWDKEANWVRIERRVREAAGNGADLVVTPEGVLDGYVIEVDTSSKRYEGRFSNRRPETYQELTDDR